jgi:hypothetical protein
VPDATVAARACGVCGAAVPTPFRAPAPELAPDLDFRPGEPTRSTLSRWLQTCRRCGAVAPDLAALTPDRLAMVRSPEYRAFFDMPSGVENFVRWAMLCDGHARAEAYLQAAWAADDAGADARVLRRRAADAWGPPDGAESALRLIDVLRRAEAFDEASSVAATLDASALDENSARILAFQRARIVARDAGRHLLSSALRPPARMPHVAHGKAARKGIFGRLFGR